MTRPGARAIIMAGLALAYGAIAAASAADRDAIRNFTAAPTITPIAAHAWHQEARLALAASNPNAALAAAWRGVRAAPLEPAATSLLGSAYFMKGDPARAHAAFSVARKLGWRDMATQAYWIGAGLARYDLALSARHLDAMMRAAPSLTQTRELVRRLEEDATGRDALTARLREGPGWIDSYAKDAADLSPPAFARRMALLRDAAAFNHRPACLPVSDAVNHLAYRAKRYAEAAQLWRFACATGRTGLISNGEFATQPTEPASPFDWNLPGSGGVSTMITDGQLIARNENPGLPLIAEQVILAPAGQPLRIQWVAQPQNGAVPLDQMVMLRCPDGNNLLDQQRAKTAGRGTWQVEVRLPGNCSYQTIGLRIPREAGEVRIDRIAIDPVSIQG